jgi:hypothetical protein
VESIQYCQHTCFLDIVILDSLYTVSTFQKELILKKWVLLVPFSSRGAECRSPSRLKGIVKRKLRWIYSSTFFLSNTR